MNPLDTNTAPAGNSSDASQSTRPAQPLLHEAVAVLSAPTQVWSDNGGDIGSAAVHGIYHSDTRVIRRLNLTVGGDSPEPIAVRAAGADDVTFVSLPRTVDDDDPDPKLRLDRRRRVHDGLVRETLTLTSALAVPTTITVRLAAQAGFSTMDHVKAGTIDSDAAPPPHKEGASARWSADSISATLSADDGIMDSSPDGTVNIVWHLTVPARGQAQTSWQVELSDDAAVVHGATTPNSWASFDLHSGDTRLERWVHAALVDVDALRMTTTSAPDEVFLGAGAPWFFTMFGRDSIWAARFLLPLGTELAASTLRALAALQGTQDVPATAEQPGKIMHELRPRASEIPGDGAHLPPLYYGSIDATPLWICLLHDAWQWGMPATEVEALLPNLEAALSWMRDYGDSDGDGFLEYIDRTGHGLANQGWKDSGDSIQWADGHLAHGPIALCEVQGYAYEAALDGAKLLDAFDRPGAEAWRGWADRLKEQFKHSFWITHPADGGAPYPAIALDRDKHRVDTVTSNIGHLLGTGILSPADARNIATRIGTAELTSGYGLRTMSTTAAGYWPLSYHGGSVWAHDTAIVISGLATEGFDAEADALIHGLLAAAEGFGYRLPELHSGDPARTTAGTPTGRPVPYPAACRPQAWSAAAAVSVLASILGLKPRTGSLHIAPLPTAPAGAIRLSGARFGSRPFDLTTDDHGRIIHTTVPNR